MTKNTAIFLTFSVSLALLQVIHQVSSSSLYKPDDPLWELDSSNFDRVIYGKNNAWIVEFYNSWCGYCIRFAPKWREFSFDIENWKNVVGVAVVNCVEADNVKLCREFNVEGYPSIRLFPPNSTASEKGHQFTGERELSYIRNQTIDFLQSQKYNPHWPNFKEVEAGSFSEMWGDLPKSVKTAYIIIEHPNSYVGREIILDLSGQRHLTVLRVLTSNEPLLNELVEDFKNTTEFMFLKVSRGGSKEVLNAFDAETSVNSTVIRDLVFETLIGRPRVKDYDGISDDDKDTKDEDMKDGVYMADLENALRYALWQEVGVRSDISGPSFAALKEFIYILRLYFPASSAVKSFLIKLNNWIDHRKGNMTGERFLGAMDKLQTISEYVPEMHEYVGCRGSTPKYRGYPCSLWTLFHTLTVQAYNMFVYTAGRTDPTPQAVLFAIRGYVKYFFSCRECSLHFQKMAINLENEVKVPKDTVLWLWQAHNQVNKRLAGDETEDPLHPKIQFPDKDACKKCRVKTDGDEIEWDKSAVLRYLQHFYKRESIVSVEDGAKQLSRINLNANAALPVSTVISDSSDAQTVTHFTNSSFLEHWNFRWFTNTDVSLCLSLYFVSALLLVVIYLLFVQRRKRRKSRYKRFLSTYP